MANKKISELTALGAAPATDDVLPIVDVSGTATTKKVTVANLLSTHAPLADPNFTGHVEVSQSDVSQFAVDATGARLGGHFRVGRTNASDVILRCGDTTTIGVLEVKAGTGGVDVADDLRVGGDLTVTGNLAGFTAALNDQTVTAYTLVAADKGKVVTCNNGAAITVTVPAGLGAGFTCTVIQKGAGQVTFATSSTTVNNRQSHTKIAGQHGVATLVATAADTFVLAGDTAS